jgi:hypothetical protein
MAFLDNSGDIILDAVLTDTGRLRLAQGNGNFKISYFAFGDDEINYNLYNKNHPSGSAYYDLDILQTPVFEAFTNNASTMKYQLISNSNTQLLYLPVLKLNTTQAPLYSNLDTYLVTTSGAKTFFTSSNAGVLYGSDTRNSTFICLDQGIDNAEVGTNISVGGTDGFDQTLEESQYTVEVNNNFVELYNVSSVAVPASFIDDDGMATYTLSYNVDASESDLVSQIPLVTGTDATPVSPIAGAVDKRIKFKLKLKQDLNTNNSLFTRFGGTTTIAGTSFYYIDSFVIVRGVTVGTQLTVPIKIIKNII